MADVGKTLVVYVAIFQLNIRNNSDLSHLRSNKIMVTQWEHPTSEEVSDAFFHVEDASRAANLLFRRH